MKSRTKRVLQRPPCPHCGGRVAWISSHSPTGATRYWCKVCDRRWTQGRDYTPRMDDLPGPDACRYCGGGCIRQGIRKSGSQIWVCKVCRKRVTSRPHRPKGQTCSYEIYLSLGMYAVRGLMEYCRATRLSQAEAIRQIFALPMNSLQLAATIDRDGRITTMPPRKPEPVEMPEPFPDARHIANSDRMRDPFFRCYPSVYADMRIAVKLDPPAVEGLRRTAAARGITHQEAARYLLENVRPPGQALQARAGGRRRDV